MKGIAHIGVWKALEEAGIRPDAIVGTSIGALVGACLAGGLGWRELTEIARKLKKEDIVSINRRALWLGGVRGMSVFDGGSFRAWVRTDPPDPRQFSELIASAPRQRGVAGDGQGGLVRDWAMREDVDLSARCTRRAPCRSTSPRSRLTATCWSMAG
jgi:hypothetical protein